MSGACAGTRLCPKSQRTRTLSGCPRDRLETLEPSESTKGSGGTRRQHHTSSTSSNQNLLLLGHQVETVKIQDEVRPFGKRRQFKVRDLKELYESFRAQNRQKLIE